MSKKGKIILGIVIIVLLIAGIAWGVYEATKQEPVSIDSVNETPNENMGLENEVNEITNETTNSVLENEIVNEISNEIQDENSESSNTEDTTKGEDFGKTEVVTGTNASREEKAEELAKKYYENKYGSSDGIDFRYESLYEDGSLIVIASEQGTTKTLAFLAVNLSTEEVKEI